MLAHRRAAAIPRLLGTDNYKDWSHKVELQMRIQKTWSAVVGPPVPIKPDVELELGDYIYVASRKHVYIQCSESLNRKAKLFLFRFIDPQIVTADLVDMSIPCLWRSLKHLYGHVKSDSKRKSTGLAAQKCKKPKLVHRGSA